MILSNEYLKKAVIEGRSHAIHDLSKVGYLMQERKLFKMFFEIRGLSRFKKKKYFNFATL